MTRPARRRRRRPVPATLLRAAILALAWTGALASGQSPLPQVTYVSLASVYVSAGAAEGLSPGDRLEVVRDGNVVARLEVQLTTTHKSDCRKVDVDGAIRVGDGVRRAPATAAPAARALGTAAAAIPVSGTPDPAAEAPQSPPGAGPEPAPAAAPADAAGAATPPATVIPAPAPTGPRSVGLRGRIGVRFMGTWDRNDGPDYQQPALDLRLDGTRVGGSDFDLSVDVRARRSYRNFGNGDSETENRTRVYRLAGAWQADGSPFRLAFGRVFTPSLSVVSLFDGVYGEYRKDRFAAGLFAGTQPDAEDFGYSGDVQEYGGFAEYGSATAAKRRWAVTGGAIASYNEGTINREFLYLQARYDDRRLSGYLTQEVDLNRGWREEQEGDRWTATSGYASLRWRASDSFGLNAGYDSRRSIRLYRDYVSPETEFDDRYRRGVWLGADGHAGEHFDYGVSVRRSDAGDDDTADAATLLLGLRRLTSAGIDVSARGTTYDNTQLEGWLVSLAIAFALGERSRLEVYGGVRRETVVTAWVPEENHDWYGLDWSLLLNRHWMFTTTLESNRGQGEDNDQVYATMSYRF